MGWLITGGIVFLLAILPLGVRIRYNQDGLLAAVIAGPFKLTVYPLPQKEKKEKKKSASESKPVQDPEAQSLPKPPQPPKLEKKKGENKENISA